MEALTAELGCTDLQVNLQEELASHEDGSCTFAGERVQLLTSKTNSARGAGNEIAGRGGIAVAGDRWTASVAPDATARRVQVVLGGEFR